MMVWVILILAAFSLSRDRCMEDTTRAADAEHQPDGGHKEPERRENVYGCQCVTSDAVSYENTVNYRHQGDAEHAQKCRHKHLAEQLSECCPSRNQSRLFAYVSVPKVAKIRNYWEFLCNFASSKSDLTCVNLVFLRTAQYGAPATIPGTGAISIIRVSGEGSLANRRQGH